MAEFVQAMPIGRFLPFIEINEERDRQVEKWGHQSHPDGPIDTVYQALADSARRACDDAASRGELTWRHIFREEAYEALAERDTDKLRDELVQTAAVIVAWLEDIDSRETSDAA